MTIHGMSYSSEYKSWQGSKNRCLNINHRQYPDYGARGITVCDRWLNFKNFLADMGLKPSPKHSLDRIDNDGDYCPENCRWATPKEQANNKRNNQIIKIEGKTLNIIQWEEKQGFNSGIIYSRLIDGWSEFDAVMTPINIDRLITIGFKTLTIAGWGKEMGYKNKIIQNRLTKGWSEFDAVMTPVKILNTVRLITIDSKTLTIAGWGKEMGYKNKIIQGRLTKGWSEFDAVMTPVESKTKK